MPANSYYLYSSKKAYEDYIAVSILVIYLPVLYIFKRKIIRTIRTEEVPSHLRWYEGAGYLMKHSRDHSKIEKLTRDKVRFG